MAGRSEAPAAGIMAKLPRDAGHISARCVGETGRLHPVRSIGEEEKRTFRWIFRRCKKDFFLINIKKNRLGKLLKSKRKGIK